jgi:transglutaminase-like putative cysteine protease
VGSELVAGSTASTPILDAGHDLIRALASRIDPDVALEPTTFVRRAHATVTETVRPVYSLDEWQAASRTLRRGRGSCSQRFAVLEAVSRARAIATRVRGLAVDGRFWYPRFPRVTPLVPDRVVLAWPEFGLPEGWVSASEVFGSLGELRSRSDDRGFANDGESLFEAVGMSAIDWDGATSVGGTIASCDLSEMGGEDLGLFDSRDDLFAEHRTMGRPIVWMLDPFLRLVSGRRRTRRP